MRARIVVKKGSLTDGDELVLVNNGNTNGYLGSGVAAAIRKACGAQFQTTLSKALEEKFKGPMRPGDVLVTDAGAHPRAKWVAHVAVMDYRKGFAAAVFPTKTTVETCCEHLWKALEQLPGHERLSVAMVALGAGTGDLGVEEPTHLAATTLEAHLAATPLSRIEKVVFYGYHQHEYEAIARVLAKHFRELERLSG